MRSAWICIRWSLALAPPSASSRSAPPIGVDDVGDLVGDRLDGGAGELGRAGAEGETADQADRGVVPPGRGQAAERRDEVHAVAAASRRPAGDVLRGGAEQLGQPRDGRAAGADVALRAASRSSQATVQADGVGCRRRPRRITEEPVP